MQRFLEQVAENDKTNTLKIDFSHINSIENQDNIPNKRLLKWQTYWNDKYKETNYNIDTIKSIKAQEMLDFFKEKEKHIFTINSNLSEMTNELVKSANKEKDNIIDNTKEKSTQDLNDTIIAIEMMEQIKNTEKLESNISNEEGEIDNNEVKNNEDEDKKKIDQNEKGE